MRKNFLNLVILVSIAGIIIITARDYFLAKKLKNITENKNTSIISQPITPSSTKNNNSEVPCQNKFFNFKKGTVWRYKLISQIEVNKEKQTIDTFFTNKIIEASGSSIIIESQFKGEEEKIVNALICKEKGVYGFPFPTQFINFIKLNSPILLLPSEEKLKKGGEWPTVSLANFGISLSNKIINEAKQSLLNLGYIDTLTIQSQLKFNPSFFKLGDFKARSFNYELGKNIGFLNLNLDLNLESLGKIKIVLKLVEFKAGP